MSGGKSGGGVIDIDLPCYGCGYNLRSIQKDKTCPECGTSVSRSLQGDRLMFSHPKWLRRLAIGTNWLMAGIIISIIIVITVMFRALINVEVAIILQITNQIALILALVGIFLVTTPEYERGSKQSMLRPWARWLLIAAGIWSTSLFIASKATPFVTPSIAITLYSARYLIHVIGKIALLLYLGSLAGRAGRSSLVVQSYLLPVGFVISWFTLLLINAIYLLQIFDIINYQSMAFELVGYVSIVYSILHGGLLIWELIFFIMLRRSLVAIYQLTTSNVDN